jgi:hypothetical protein
VSRVAVTIDRLVLSGIDPGDRDLLVAGLRDGLERALSESPLDGVRSRRAAVVRIGGLTLEPGRAGTRALGTGVGQAIGRAAR